jgi:hypothetical protein
MGVMISNTLRGLLDNAEQLVDKRVRRVLLLYEERVNSVGDSCRRANKLRYFKTFFEGAAVEMNFKDTNHYKFCEVFLKNNPYIDRVMMSEWEEIDFENYDVVFCAVYNEERVLDFLHSKYGERISSGGFQLAVFSIANLILRPQEGSIYIFPIHGALTEYLCIPRPGELYVSEEEKDWANQWLESNGIREGNDLYVILDSTKESSKLLNINVHLKFLSALLSKDNARVLVFDEKNIGKDRFYREGLGERLSKKMIFSKRFSLRNNLCLIASKYTRMVFGPCTGVMHCSSSIFNYSVLMGAHRGEIPLMVVYTGWLGKEKYNVNEWWGTSPLVNCLLLMKKDGRKTLVTLDSLSSEDKGKNDSLPCSEYTAELLLDFVERRL